jgi:hypothetical protein
MKFGLIITFCLSLTSFFLPEESNAQSISGTVNRYFKVTHYKASYNGLRVQNVSGLNVGDRVMIIQMKGATTSTTNNSTFGDITNSPAMKGAGLYEMATIAAFINDTLLFKSILVNTYDFTQSVQLVYVPRFTNVTVSGTLTASPWDSTTGTGGIIAIEATGTITLNANIDASGTGFKGGVLVNSTSCSFFQTPSGFSYSLPSSQNINLTGAYKGEGINRTSITYNAGKGKQSNGGGGGNNHNTGGGGGGNYEVGGRGGNQTTSSSCNGTNYGIGGAALKTYGYSLTNNRLFLGGGGGAGQQNNNEGTPGGNGGGIIYIKCNELIGNGYSITANGTQGINTILGSNEANGDGGGGGGAGGDVLLNVPTYTTSLIVEAKGADGSKVGFQNFCSGPGGGGGGGVVWSKIVLPANVTSSAAGGASGIVKIIPGYNPVCRGLPNGATRGLNGVVQPGFIPVEGAVKFESDILKSVNITAWYGKRLYNAVELKWKVEDASSVAEILLEKKTANGSFKVIRLYTQINDGFQTYTDQSNEFPAIYRLKVLSKTGKAEYTNQLFFDRIKVQRLNMYPNPVADDLNIQLPGSTTGKVFISVFDYTGKQVMQKEMVLSGSQSTILLKLTSLSAGMYTIQLNKKDELFIGKIIKQ